MEDKEDDLIENEEVIGGWRTEGEKVDVHFAPQQEHRLHRAFNLELIQDRNDLSSGRPIIPATTLQVLCFLRSYITSSCKVEILCMQNSNFNLFIWAYIVNVIFKTLPCYYLYIFLGSYTPDNHLFLSKMIPFFYGFGWILFTAGFLDLLVGNDLCSILMDYIVLGMTSKNPWADCAEDYKNYTLYNGTVAVMKCLNMSSFVGAVKGVRPNAFKPIGYTTGGEPFQLAQIMFFQSQWIKHTDGKFGLHKLYCIGLWSCVILFNKKLYHTTLWKAQHIMQWLMNGIFILILLNLYYNAVDGDDERFSNDNPIDEALNEACKLNSISMLSESLLAPPLLHLLSARRNQVIKPTRDSAFVSVNNAVYFIFRGVLRNCLRVFCNNMIGVPIYASANNHLTFFYTYPIYFSKFELGHIWVVLTFIAILANEFFTWIITFQCLIEVLIWEWTQIKRIPVTIFLCAMGCVTNILANEHYKLYIYVVSKLIPTWCEILVVYLLYPFGRLLDDIHFHFGSQPSLFEIVVLRLMPFYYAWRCFRIIGTLRVLFVTQNRIADSWLLALVTLVVILVPVVFGALYVTFQEVYRKKRYIDSTAPRVLSRHLMHKSESRVYKIGIRYDSPVSWRSVNTKALGATPGLELRRKSKVEEGSQQKSNIITETGH